MANYVLKDAYLMLNSDDMSADLKSISFTLEGGTVDNTCMGDDELNFLFGMKNATFSATFAAENTDNTGTTEELCAIWSGGAAVAFIIKANGSVTSATNPEYTGNCIMTSFPVVDGTVGDEATHNCSFQVTGAVARSES